MPRLAHADAIYLGLDVHKDSISVGVLNPGAERVDVERIFADEESVRRMVGRFPDPRLLRVCYEAGPTGYDMARLLSSMGVRCEVIAPSMIPKAPGDRVKTDSRDCRRLARLHRAGELTAIRVPTISEEAVRDLCRGRSDMVEDLTRARYRLTKFLLRHSRVWRGGANWTIKHDAWLAAQHFDEPAMQTTFEHYLAVLAERSAQLSTIDADLVTWADTEPFRASVARLAAYRGVSRLGALCLQATTEGQVQFNVAFRVAMSEFAGWEPERITAFFGGIAQVLAAKAGVEREAL